MLFYVHFLISSSYDFMYIFLFHPHMTSLWQQLLWKLFYKRRNGEFKEFAQGHTAGSHKNQECSTSHPDVKPVLLTFTLSVSLKQCRGGRWGGGKSIRLSAWWVLIHVVNLSDSTNRFGCLQICNSAKILKKCVTSLSPNPTTWPCMFFQDYHSP